MTDHPLNIGVMGYYGFGNAGDEIILDALSHFLSPHRIITIPLGFSPTRQALQRLENYDFFILGGGGLYNSPTPPSPFFCFDQWMDQVATPIGVLGLGVEAIGREFLAATQRFVDAAEFFVVRDEQSKQLIGHSKIQVAPDLTFYKPPKVEMNHGRGEEIVCGVNIRGGKTLDPVLEWLPAISKLPGAKRALPFSMHPELSDREILQKIDPACPEKFSPSVYGEIDILVGFALHSVIFAVQNGVPVIAVNYKPKLRRFMEEVGLGEYVLELDEWDKLPSVYEKALANDESIRQCMLAYTRASEKTLRQVLQPIKEIIESSSRRRRTPRQKDSALPLVSVIVDGSGSDPASSNRSISSAQEQTYQPIEKIFIGDLQPAAPDGEDMESPTAAVRWIRSPAGPVESVRLALEQASGQYVTWLHSGLWLAADGVETAVRALQQNPEAALAYSDISLTHEGVIERPVHGRIDPSTGPSNCFVVLRTEKARELLNTPTDGPISLSSLANALSRQAIYVPHTLGYRQSTPWEMYLYRSALAFVRQAYGDADRWLKSALAQKPQLSQADKREIHEMFAEMIYQSLKAPISRGIVENIIRELDQAPGEIRSLKGNIVSDIAMHWYFEALHSRKWQEMITSMRIGVRYDPANWFRNRGVWISLVRRALKFAR